MVTWLKNILKKNSALFYLARVIKYGSESVPMVFHCRDYTQNKYIRNFLKVIVAPWCVFRYFFPEKISVSGREGLAFVLIAKNEAQYIEEWINFHLKQGVSHFFIYDNESTDNFYDVLKPYIEADIVTYHTIKGKYRQCDAYNMALAEYGRKFKYMGFIDCDEFVFVRKLLTGGGATIYIILSINLFLNMRMPEG